MASIALSAHFEKFVEELLAEGRYSDASEVVQEGLRMLEAHESRERWIREELPIRWAAHQADPSSAIPAEDVHAKLRERMAEKR